jgi:hypothetical protein
MKKILIIAIIAFAAACGGKKKADTKPTGGSGDHGSAAPMGSGDHGSGDHGSGSAAPTP